MPDQKKDDKGPYTIRGRASDHGEEVTLGTAMTLEDARDAADGFYADGRYPIVNVSDRDTRNVYRAGPGQEDQAAGKGGGPGEPGGPE